MWWDTHMINWNGKSLLKKEVDMIIDSDASLTGWGATSHTSGQDIPEERNQDVSTPQVRQYHGSGIYKQPGRSSLQGIGRLSQEPMDVVSGEEHSHHSPAPTRGSEHNKNCLPSLSPILSSIY